MHKVLNAAWQLLELHESVGGGEWGLSRPGGNVRLSRHVYSEIVRLLVALECAVGTQLLCRS